jgi:hypothetical protein
MKNDTPYHLGEKYQPMRHLQGGKNEKAEEKKSDNLKECCIKSTVPK